jgi:alpha-1,4-digalacturonate transport system permease protein
MASATSTPGGAGGVLAFLTRTRGRGRLDLTDWLSYAYLILGIVLMFGPVLWVAASSLKTQAAILEFPPSFLPYGQQTAQVEGYDEPLPLFRVQTEQGERVMAQARRIGIQAQMVDPADPTQKVNVNINEREPVRALQFAWSNYTELFRLFNFGLYFWNSLFITVVATLITLLFNSMAAFALSKYKFRGRTAVFVLIIATLMIPPTIVLVPTFLVVSQMGLLNNPWGVIWPAVATPTGVFLLRQYMLTIPDDLLDAARMDNASEWRIYWRIVLPLAAPALAVLAIFSIMWRWNEFLWPLIVLTRSEEFTLQLALNSFQGELSTQWNNLLAMTVLTLLPITLVFAFLQRYIAAGIASTGVK